MTRCGLLHFLIPREPINEDTRDFCKLSWFHNSKREVCYEVGIDDIEAHMKYYDWRRSTSTHQPDKPKQKNGKEIAATSGSEFKDKLKES